MAADLDALFSQIPLDQVASQLGVDSGTAGGLVQRVLPALVGGMDANARNGGASSLGGAVQQHDGGLFEGLLGGGADALGGVDTDDGDKIVDHVFGSNRGSVVDALGSAGGGDERGLIARLLPMLAPIVMSWLAKELGSAPSTPGSGGQPILPGAPASGGDELESMLGNLLGGALGGDSGGGMGALLGDLLGGGTK